MYALLALVVPLPAFALSGGESAAQSLSVSASLGGCGLAETTIVCEIDASWNSIDDADYYTASVTAPNGSVTDFGGVGSGSSSVYVPYVGDGTYSVQVTAWGEPEDPEEKPKVVAREIASSKSDAAKPEAKDEPSQSGGSDRDKTQAEEGSASAKDADPSDGERGEDGTDSTDATGSTDATDAGSADPAPADESTAPASPTGAAGDCRTTTTTPDPSKPATPDAAAGESKPSGADGDEAKTSTTAPAPAPEPPDPACP